MIETLRAILDQDPVRALAPAAVLLLVAGILALKGWRS